MSYHHFVSAFHLAEFTSERARDGRLYVFDLDMKRRWRSSVNAIGGRKGYNAVRDVDGVGPEDIEGLLSRKYENTAAPILRAINDTHDLPADPELATLLQYIALLAANNPSRRGAMNDAQERALWFMAQQMVADPDAFDAIQADHKRAGVPILGEISFNDLKQLVETGQFSYQMPTLSHLRGLGNLVDDLSQHLYERSWSLLIATESLDFVVSDHPVSLEWMMGVQRGLRPGFASRETEVVIPLSKRTALLGVYARRAWRLRADTAVVAETNRRSVIGAGRFVYSADATFYFATGGGLCSSDRLLSDAAPQIPTDT